MEEAKSKCKEIEINILENQHKYQNNKDIKQLRNKTIIQNLKELRENIIEIKKNLEYLKEN